MPPRLTNNRSSPLEAHKGPLAPANHTDASDDEGNKPPVLRVPHIYGSRSVSEFIRPRNVTEPERRGSPTKDCCKSPDWLWFAMIDESPGSNSVYVFDPGSETARNMWLRELMNILEMQVEIQLALQNPRRFYYTTGSRKQVKTLSSTDMTALLEVYIENNTSLSAFSSTTQLVEDAGPGSAQGRKCFSEGYVFHDVRCFWFLHKNVSIFLPQNRQWATLLCPGMGLH